MKRRKLNIKKLSIFILLVVLVIVGIIMGIKGIINTIKLHKTSEYKLTKLGYTEEESKVLVKLLSKKDIEYVLSIDYNHKIVEYSKFNDFDPKKIEDYMEYARQNKNTDLQDVVTLVNIGKKGDWYDTIKDTNTSKKELMLVNKIYQLKEDYEPEDLMKVPATYAYSGVYISESIYNNLKKLISAAKESGYTLVLSQGYRSYGDQLKAYNNIKSNYGQARADEDAARAGHSEYQTGLSVLIVPYAKEISDVKENEEYNWLIKNAHKYGFIQRYPEGKEEITGFKYDPWRFRYVGVTTSTRIYNEKITFDEYYEYNIK